jgi:hypothetical protein
MGVPLDGSVDGLVFRRQQPLIIQYTRADIRHFKTVDRVSKHQTNSLDAVPLIVRGEVVGVLEALNKRDDAHYTEEDLTILETLGALAALSVDGTLIEAWASMKSFKPTDGSDRPPRDGGRDGGRNGETDFHGHKRSNATHASSTDPEARLYRKGPGKEARLCFIGHALMENRSGLLVDGCVTLADGHAERVAALHMIEPRADRPRAITLGADKGYDAEDFVNELRSMRVTPHVAQNTRNRRSAIDGRTTRHAGYAASQRIRKRIEEAFGWIKTVAGHDKTRFRGTARVGFAFTFAAAAYNLVRLPKLLAQVPT